MKFKTIVMATAVAFTMSAAANAAPVHFTYTGITDNKHGLPRVDGTGIGETLTIDAVFDNGGTNLVSQTWDTDDFISITATTSGGYSFTSNQKVGVGVMFGTNSSSNLAFFDIRLNLIGTDTAGNTLFNVFMDGVNELIDAQASASGSFSYIDASPAPGLNNITLTMATVPLPASALFLGAGLAAIGGLRRRRG